jgi:hypothetical protein
MELDPGGTAAAADAFLLVEVPLPWPKEITDHPCLEGAADVGARVQGVVPSEATATTGEYAVTLYRRPRWPFVGYERREIRGPIDQIAAMCRRVIDAPIEGADVTDLLVCSHGTRDRCCGSLGTALFFAAARPGGVRVRRTSHTGGHRFAPTAVLLPEGTVWGWLDDALLAAVLERSGDIGKVIPHYRGSTALAAPAAQVAERAVLATVGWSWLDTPRHAEVVERQREGERDGDRSVVRVASEVGSWRAVVDRIGSRPQPLCGVDLSAARKADDVLRLVELTAD